MTGHRDLVQETDGNLLSYDGATLAQQIGQETGMAVMDGLYKEDHGTAGFIIKGLI